MRRRGRPEFKSEIARRVQALLPFACPNLRLLSERELRYFERFLTADRAPDCRVIGGEEQGRTFPE
jgi:hypothetical protein